MKLVRKSVENVEEKPVEINVNEGKNEGKNEGVRLIRRSDSNSPQFTPKSTNIEPKIEIDPETGEVMEDVGKKEGRIEGNQTTHIQKIIPNIVNRVGNIGSAMEICQTAFDLSKIDNQGYRISLEGKMLFNFYTFDAKTNKQLNLIPAYMDISEWLNVCHFISTNRLIEATDKARENQRNGNYKYCSFIYQSQGGSFKPIFKVNGKSYGGQGQAISTLFKITPAQTEGKWIFSAEILKGVASPEGLIMPKKGEKPVAKINVSLTYDQMIGMCEMSKMAIQAHFCKLNRG